MFVSAKLLAQMTFSKSKKYLLHWCYDKSGLQLTLRANRNLLRERTVTRHTSPSTAEGDRKLFTTKGRQMKKLLLAASFLTVAMLPAQADSVVVLGGTDWTINAGTDLLTLSPVVPGGNQPQNVQCIICGENQPQQSSLFGYTDFHNAGNQTTEAYFSTNVSGGANPGSDTIGIPYGQGFLTQYLIDSGATTLNFTIGVDVNDTNKAQTLDAFYLLNLTTHTVLAVFNDPTLVPSQNNGTGFPDYTLGNFSLALGSDLSAGDNLLFFARITGANDGPDSFFIQPAAVPGPIVGAGIPGLIAAAMGLWGFNRNRRRRNVEA